MSLDESSAAPTDPRVEEPPADHNHEEIAEPVEAAAEGSADAGTTEEGTAEAGEAGDEEGEDAAAGDGDADDVDFDEEVYKLKAHKRSVPVPASDKPKGERRRERRLPDAPAERAESQPRSRTPRGRAIRKKATPAPVEHVEEEEDALANLTPEEREQREIEARLDAALAPASKRRKRLSADDIEMMQDDAIAKLRDEMRHVALLDVECIEQGKPAINKMRLLPQVERTLQRSSLADSILDGNLLESVRIWLEPLPDASLPSFEIQKALFQALTTLPIKTIHLRESGIGRVLLFYLRSKRPHPMIKRLAQKLMGDWTRPIIGRSDSYRDKSVATAEFDPNRGSALGSAKSRPSSSNLYEENANRRGRAAIPVQMGTSYSVAPVSNIDSTDVGSHAKDSQLRRMKTKLMAGRAKSKKSQVSVEGKELH